MNRKFAALSSLALLLACQPARAQFCPADTNGDASVNVSDLINVINSWGYVGPPPAGPVPHPDVNGDGAVNVSDLLGILNGWGPCLASFVLDDVPFAPPTARAGGNNTESVGFEWCIYQVTASDPGSALAVGNVVCVRCPDNWFNSCPDFTLSTFNGVTGNPGAVSTGVTIQAFNGYCQPCPANSRGKFRRIS